MVKEQIQYLKNDFKAVWDEIQPLAILLFGSQVIGETTPSSDTDICIVLGKNLNKEKDRADVLSKIWQNIGGKYDVWLFEELKLKIQAEILENYEIIYCDDPPELGEYFRPYWKKVEEYYYRLKVAYGRL